MARTERVALADAAGRIVASGVTSSIDVPPFARAVMDGYAVIAADTVGATRATPVRLGVAERIYTGQIPRGSIAPGLCAEIATGAPMPEGADAVVIVEDTGAPADRGRGAGEAVEIFTAAAAGQNIGRRGADILAGALVVNPGEVLTPGRVGSLAAVGRADVEVYERPRVAILSTGNEVVDPGQALAPGQIFDVNSFTLAAIAAAHGGVPERHQAVQDSLAALTEALDACAGADVIVFSGGSSVGERDLILDVVAARGEMIFHGIAIKPGKPTAFALVNGRPLFGMPGNPTSCLSNAYILLVPFLRATAHLPPFQPRIARVPLARRIDSVSGRHQIYTVRLIDGSAHPAFKGSGDITSLSHADGYIEIAEDQTAVDAGTAVDVTLF
jgi:molybdenum cofactor synthesis domain-containing protein